MPTKKKSNLTKGDLLQLTKSSAEKYKMSTDTKFIFIDGFEGEESGQRLTVAAGLPGEDGYFIVDEGELVKSKDQNFETKMLTIMLDIASGIKQLNNQFDESNHARWHEIHDHGHVEDELEEMLKTKPAKKDDSRH